METTGGRRFRDRVLTFLFTLALAWALLVLAPILLGQHVVTFNPFPERHPLYGPTEDLLLPLAATCLASALALLIVRLAPRFPVTPESVSSIRLTLTLLGVTALVGIVLLMVLVGVSLVVDPPGPNPENPQHIPAMFWLAPMLTAGLTPLGGLLAGWWWTRRRGG